jgi:hypothetical protein
MLMFPNTKHWDQEVQNSMAVTFREGQVVSQSVCVYELGHGQIRAACWSYSEAATWRNQHQSYFIAVPACNEARGQTF